MAAAGQIMALHDCLFGLMDLQSAYVPIAWKDFSKPTFKTDLWALVEDLLSKNAIPVFSEVIPDSSLASCLTSPFNK